MSEVIRRISVHVEVDTNKSSHVLDTGDVESFDHAHDLVTEFLIGLADLLGGVWAPPDSEGGGVVVHLGEQMPLDTDGGPDGLVEPGLDDGDESAGGDAPDDAGMA